MRDLLAADVAKTLGVLLLASCAKNVGPSHEPKAPPPNTFMLELEVDRGAAPALPNPMLVTDSVHGGAFESCYQSFRPSGNADRDLVQMTSLCGPPNAMKPVSPVVHGTQSQRDQLARFTFRGETGRCYRIFSATDRGVRDMDMAMLDPNKNVVGHDTNEDAFPMLNPDGPFCLTRPGLYTVLVSVEKGTGRYALQVWGF
jgi:hypothetical protein